MITFGRQYLRFNVCAFLAFYLNSNMVLNIIDLLYIFFTGKQPLYLLTIAIKLINFSLLFLIILRRGIEVKFLLLVFFMAGLYGVSALITPKILIIFRPSLSKMAFTFSVVYVISRIDRISELVKFLIPYVYLSIVYALLYYFLRHTNALDNEQYNYMVFTYNSMIPMLTAMSIAFQRERSIRNMGPFIAALCFMFLFAINLLAGARGALLCVGLCALMLLYFLSDFQKVIWVSVLGVFALIVILNYHQLISVMVSLFPDSRTVLKLQTGELVNTQTSARMYIYKHILSSFAENPFAVHGLFSDRIYVAGLYKTTNVREINGWYAHNVVLELLYQFGVWCIPVIALWAYMFAKQAMYVKKSNNAALKCVFCVSAAYCLGQLTVSSSYLIAQSFAFMMGILLYMNRKKERRRHEIIDNLSINRTYAKHWVHSLD